MPSKARHNLTGMKSPGMNSKVRLIRGKPLLPIGASFPVVQLFVRSEGAAVQCSTIVQLSRACMHEANSPSRP